MILLESDMVPVCRHSNGTPPESAGTVSEPEKHSRGESAIGVSFGGESGSVGSERGVRD